METKQKKNPYATFKKLTIANTAIGWVEFAYILFVAIEGFLLWAKFPDSQFFISANYTYVFYFGTALMLANIGIAIAQSVFARRIGQVIKGIGYEQIICLLIMLIGFAFIFGDLGIYCASLLPVDGQPIPEWLGTGTTLVINEHWIAYIASGAFLASAVCTAGFAVYNSILCAKVKVFKAKKA